MQKSWIDFWEPKLEFNRGSDRKNKLVLLRKGSTVGLKRGRIRRKEIATRLRIATHRNWTVELAFQTKPLRNICEDEVQAKLEWDVNVVKALKHRLADLRSASSAKDIIVGRPRVSSGPEGEFMTVDLAGTCRLVFAANHIKNPMTDDNRLDWAKVTRIKILRIEKVNA